MGMIFVSEEACEPLIEDLRRTGRDLFLVKRTDLVTEAAASHPDLYMCRAGNMLVVDDSIRTEPDLRAMYENAIEETIGDAADSPMIPAFRPGGDASVVFRTGALAPEYPYDAAYDAVATEKYFIHNLEYTLPFLKEQAGEAGLEFIHVKQGYTKCSCVVVNRQALITADQGMLRTIRAYNRLLCEEGQEKECIDCLEIETGHVELPGVAYGFLGGASGQVERKIFFNGDLTLHPDFDRITAFIRKYGLEPVWYEGKALTDIGSIISFP